MAFYSRRTSRFALGLVALVAAVLVLAPIAIGQGMFAYPAAPFGTPQNFVPVTADTKGNVIWIDGGTLGGFTTLAGDVTGPAGANTDVKINGASVPASGALTTGNVLQVSGASALTYSPVNLAGGSNYVTGNLPTGNIAPGSNGQVLATHAAATGWSNTIGDTGTSTTMTGSFTQSGGTFSFTGNGASQVSTSSGALTLDSAAALNLGTSTATSVNQGNAANTTAQTINTTAAGTWTYKANAVQEVQLAEFPSTPSTGCMLLGNSPNASTGYALCGDGSSVTRLNSATQVNFDVGGADKMGFTSTTLFPASAGGIALGATNVPFGATYSGAGNAGYYATTAISGTHNSQDNFVTWDTKDAQINATYSAVNFNTYSIAAGHHGLVYTCTANGRVITPGSGGTCSFWATGVHGAADSTFGCTARATGWYTGSAWSAYTVPFYQPCDSTSTTTPTTGVASGVLIFSATTSTNTVTVQWAAFNDSCATPPVLDIQSTCFISDN